MKCTTYLCLVLLFLSAGCQLHHHKMSTVVSDSLLMKEIYRHQRSWFHVSLHDDPNYVSIINLARSYRGQLYEKNGIRISALADFIILDGYAPGWGTYECLFIGPEKSFAYRMSGDGKWEVAVVHTDNSIMSKKSGIRSGVIDKVRSWDTACINQLKHRIGSSVSDGASYIATRVQLSQGRIVQLETMAFEEFPDQF